jgi:hypothetical protein
MRFTDVRKFDSRFSCLQQAHIRVAPGLHAGWVGRLPVQDHERRRGLRSRVALAVRFVSAYRQHRL